MSQSPERSMIGISIVIPFIETNFLPEAIASIASQMHYCTVRNYPS